MANWLDLSNNANCFESMYVNGFVDMSGGSLQLRNADNHLLVGGDASFNGGVYLGGKKLGDTDVVESITFTGGPSYQLGQDIDGEAKADQSGISVSINGDGTIVAIGARYNDGNGSNAGHVRIYEYDGTVWNQLGQDIDSEASGDQSGSSVSLNSDGTIVAIGAPFNEGTGVSYMGHVRIYQYDSSNDIWNQIGQDIDGEASSDQSGFSVSINSDGTIVAIGARYNHGTATVTNWYSGHVRIYQYDSGNDIWNQLGQDIDGEAANDQSGYSVSLSGDGTIVAIGALYNDGTGAGNEGHVRIYQYDGTVWNQLGQDIDGEASSDYSGSSVSISSDGSRVAIGAYYNEGTTTSNAGHVRIYEYDGTIWNQLGQDIDGEATNDWSGFSVSINSDGTIVAIGARLNDGTGAADAGHVRIYQYDGTVWNQLGQDIDGEAAGDYYGYSVSISSDGISVAIGAYYNEGTTTYDAGHVRVYELDHTKNYVQVIKQAPLQIGVETQRLGYAADISGIVDISGALFTHGDASMNGNLYVSGDVTIDGALSFGSATIAASNVSFSSDISMNDRLFVNVSDVSYSHITDYLTEINYTGTFIQLGDSVDGSSSNEDLGYSVSLNDDGSIIAIGAKEGGGSSRGTVLVFQYDGTGWYQLGQNIDGEASSDRSGWSVSLNGDGTIVAIGAYDNDANGSLSGHVRIYEYDGTNWIQLGQDIDGEAAGDYSGWSVSISSDGTIVAIGAPNNDGTSVSDTGGHVRIYEYDGTNWIQLGQDIDGEATGDKSGWSVSISGDGTRVAIGAYKNDGNGTKSGHVRIYEYDGTIWIKLGQDIDGEAANDNSGQSVSLSSDGNNVAMGAPQNRGGPPQGAYYVGHVRIYKYDGTNWIQKGQDIDNDSPIQNDDFGYAVSISGDGNIVIVGAPYKNGTYSNDDDGQVSLYQYDSVDDVWNQLGTYIDGARAFDYLGQSVSLSSDGTRFAIGILNGSSYYGEARVYELEHTFVTTPIYQSIHSDVDSSGTFSTDISLNNTMIVPGNITVVDSSSNSYGSYTVYTDKAATNFFSVGKSASHVFNIVDKDNAGVYMASGSTSFTSTSDARLKTAIEPLEDATEKLMQLKPCTYKWKTQEEADPKKHVGFIAQEVEALFPNLVNENDGTDGSTYKGVATTDLIPYLVKTCILMDEQLSKMEEYIKSKQST